MKRRIMGSLVAAAAASSVTAVPTNVYACNNMNSSCYEQDNTLVGTYDTCSGAGLEGTSRWGVGIYGRDFYGGMGAMGGASGMGIGVYGFSNFGGDNNGSPSGVVFDGETYCAGALAPPVSWRSQVRHWQHIVRSRGPGVRDGLGRRIRVR